MSSCCCGDELGGLTSLTMKRKVPEFRSEAEEFEFWSKADSAEYIDWSQAQRVKFPNLKPTLRTYLRQIEKL